MDDGGMAVWSIIPGLVVVAFIVWLYVRIVHKAGYSGWWCLLLFVPFVNIIMIWVFAFSSWPSLRPAAPAAPDPPASESS